MYSSTPYNRSSKTKRTDPSVKNHSLLIEALINMILLANKTFNQIIYSLAEFEAIVYSVRLFYICLGTTCQY